jgi:multidrug transporter EmrE-like cation transporter
MLGGIKSSDILWLLLASLSGAVAPIIIKYNSSDKITNKFYLPILAWFVYGISIISYVYVFKSGNISTIYPIIKGLTIFLVILMGVFLFNEKLKIVDIISILLIFIAIFLLSIK